MRLLAISLYALAVVVIAIATVRYGTRIDSIRIPMQWGFDGNPTWFAPRLIGLWFPLIIGVLVGGVMLFAGLSGEPQGNRIWYGLIAFSLIVAIATVWHLAAVARWAARQ
jgi:hypothetical protein